MHSKPLQQRNIFDISETLTLQRYVNISFETLTLKYFQHRINIINIMSLKSLNLLNSTAIIISTYARYSLECAEMDNSQKNRDSRRNEKQLERTMFFDSVFV